MEIASENDHHNAESDLETFQKMMVFLLKENPPQFPNKQGSTKTSLMLTMKFTSALVHNFMIWTQDDASAQKYKGWSRTLFADSRKISSHAALRFTQTST
jgi:hypothetical protein